MANKQICTEIRGNMQKGYQSDYLGFIPTLQLVSIPARS